MDIIKKYFSLFLLSISCFVAYSQDKTEQLALQYFSDAEYQKASDLYEKLFSKNPKSMYLYDNLLKCYTSLKNFDDAQKLVKKQIRRNEGNSYFLVDQGYIEKLSGQKDKAEKIFNEQIKNIPPYEFKIVELAGAFQKRNENEFAIKTFVLGRKILNSELLFSSELAGLHMKSGNTKEMIEEYLNLMQLDESSVENVQGLLQNVLDKNSDFEILKSALQKRIKEQPNRYVFYDMLIWMYVQRSDYDNALIYAKSLDKRFKEDGLRIITLGILAISNSKFDAAINIFRQVELMGKEGANYMQARLGILESQNKKLIGSSNYTIIELRQMEKEYELFIKEFINGPLVASCKRDLARLQAFYIKDYASAIRNFEELISSNWADYRFKAECKLDLGDLYVLKGEIWEAMLLYGQVDKDMKEEPIGQEAKYRNARLSYYMGEFEWARAQLDILKTATTQLIANNALELSLLIQDNTVDSIEEPLKLFAKADLNYFQNNYDTCLILLDELEKQFPRHSLADDILFLKAGIYFNKNDFSKSIAFLEQLLKENGSDILGDNALLMLARIYEDKLKNPVKAKELYESFLEKYPGSLFVTEVRKKLRFLRGDVEIQ